MNFIEKYDKVLTLDECNHIISLFKQCPFLNRGYAGGNLNLGIKNSVNLNLYFGFDERCQTTGNVEINNIIAPKLRECVDLYKDKYPAGDKHTGKVIKILDKGDIVSGNDGVEVITNSGLEITADNSTYYKKKSLVEIKENIIAKDKINKIDIFANKATYNKIEDVL